MLNQVRKEQVLVYCSAQQMSDIIIDSQMDKCSFSIADPWDRHSDHRWSLVLCCSIKIVLWSVLSSKSKEVTWDFAEFSFKEIECFKYRRALLCFWNYLFSACVLFHWLKSFKTNNNRYGWYTKETISKVKTISRTEESMCQEFTWLGISI